NIDSSKPVVFTALHDTAIKLFDADKNNSAAEIAIQTSVVRPWLGGVEQDETVIKDTLDKLLKLIAKYPDNADLPMFAAQGKIHLAEKRHQQENEPAAKKLTDEGNAIMEKALKAAPNSAAMYFSAAQVASMQKQI